MKKDKINKFSLCVSFEPNENSSKGYMPKYHSRRSKNEQRILYPYYRIISSCF